METPNKLENAITSTFKIIRAKVQITGQRWKQFKTNAGTKQGDSIKSLLFTVVMDKIIKQIKDEQYSDLAVKPATSESV